MRSTPKPISNSASMTKNKVAPTDEEVALARAVDLLREKLGPRRAADLLESYALDLATEADKQEDDLDGPAA